MSPRLDQHVQVMSCTRKSSLCFVHVTCHMRMLPPTLCHGHRYVMYMSPPSNHYVHVTCDMYVNHNHLSPSHHQIMYMSPLTCVCHPNSSLCHVHVTPKSCYVHVYVTPKSSLSQVHVTSPMHMSPPRHFYAMYMHVRYHY